MAFKNKTLIEIAMFSVLEGMQVKDNNDIAQTVIDLQVDLDTRRCLLKFANGDTCSCGLMDTISVDVSSISLTTSHTQPANTIQLNKQRLKSKKRDE